MFAQEQLAFPMQKNPEIFTVGYERQTPEKFVALLRKNGVRRVLDVRALPLSRRAGFSKNVLREHLREGGIEYVHVREAGNPYRDRRQGVEVCLALYTKHLGENPGVVETLLRLAREKPSVLLCLEANHAGCHRSVIARAMGDLAPEMAVRNL